ncbi:tRNA-uridine aminocarboxypropyltransferase [Marinobacteraceae bacterium S3BR75-40.1]
MGSDRCSRCGVHQKICVCDQCSPITGTPPVWVVQDKQEAGHSKGTARLVEACLVNARRVRACHPSDLAALEQCAADVSMGLMFPTPESQPLESADVTAISEWILLDGTWRKAKRLFLSHPWLQALPQFHFAHPPPSQYRIRKAPGQGQLATSEAVAHLLRHVAPECNVTPLDRALDALVSRQLAQIPPELRHRYE